jgi:hypothetical protein
MAYINLITKAYPFFEGDLRLQFPDVVGTAFPNYQLVIETPYPRPSVPSVITEGQPIFNKGNYVQNWLVRLATQEEIDARVNKPSPPNVGKPKER